MSIADRIDRKGETGSEDNASDRDIHPIRDDDVDVDGYAMAQLRVRLTMCGYTVTVENGFFVPRLHGEQPFGMVFNTYRYESNAWRMCRDHFDRRKREQDRPRGIDLRRTRSEGNASASERIGAGEGSASEE